MYIYIVFVGLCNRATLPINHVFNESRYIYYNTHLRMTIIRNLNLSLDVYEAP